MFRPESHWEDVINRRKKGQEKKRLRNPENREFLTMDSIPCQQKFPFKLWNIVNSCTTNAINWGKEGRSIIVNYSLFQQQYLDCRAFKTANLTSFIRQLNLYGFHKIASPRKVLSSIGPNAAFHHEFENTYFVRGHPELLTKICRKISTPTSAFKMDCKSPGPKHFTAGKKSQKTKNDLAGQYSFLQKALDNAAVKREKFAEYDKETQTVTVNMDEQTYNSEVLTELVTDEFPTTDWTNNFEWAETHETESITIDSKEESLVEEQDEPIVITELVPPDCTKIQNNPPGERSDHSLVQVENQGFPVYGFWDRGDYASVEERYDSLVESPNQAVLVQAIGYPSGQWAVKE